MDNSTISYRLKQDIVMEAVREWIIAGKYRQGDQLPTDEDLANIFQMNRRTIAMGLKQLVAENILERAPRRGTIVKKHCLQPLSNAVALIAMTQGDVYGEMMRWINLSLQEHQLYPVVLDNRLINDHDSIISFLERMTKHQQPYGFLAIGDTKFPYEQLKESPEKYANTIFLFRYHYPEELTNCRYILTDYEDFGRQIVEYFAKRGFHQIIFPAIHEPEYKGPWSSMQVQLMRSIAAHAEKNGIFFDEPLFWRLHGGAPLEETLVQAFKSLSGSAGVFGWSDAFLVNNVSGGLLNMGLTPQKDVTFLGQFNTPFAEKYHFDSFDIRADETVNLAVNMLTGFVKERKVLLPPKLVRHTVE